LGLTFQIIVPQRDPLSDNPTPDQVRLVAFLLYTHCSRPFALVGDLAVEAFGGDRQPQTVHILIEGPGQRLEECLDRSLASDILPKSTEGNPLEYVMKTDGLEVAIEVLVAKGNQFFFPTSLQNQTEEKFIPKIACALPFLGLRSLLEQKIHQLHQWTVRPREFIEEADRGGLERGIEDLRTFVKASFRSERKLMAKDDWEKLSPMLISILGFAVLMGISFDRSGDWKGEDIKRHSRNCVKTARRNWGLTS
jgi:hypothetical protein